MSLPVRRLRRRLSNESNLQGLSPSDEGVPRRYDFASVIFNSSSHDVALLGELSQCLISSLLGSWPKAAKRELTSCGGFRLQGTCGGNDNGVSGGQGLAFSLFAEGQEQDSDYEGESGEGHGRAEGLEVANARAD
jgi:hypothetical protein